MIDTLVGRSIWDEDVPTPLVYVDRRALERNIQRMAEAARQSGVALRPHAKTHKIAEVAKLQLDAGAVGLTVAKLGEALALAEAGVETSFMVAQPYVGPKKVRRQLELSETCEVIACVDSVDLAGAMIGLDLVLIVDTGYGRLGVAAGEAADRAEEIAALPGVRFRGIRSHTGHAYGVISEDARRKIAFEDARVLSELATSIRSRGLTCEIVSVGSTPGTTGLASATAFQGVTEWRPGNYAFFDRMQLSMGTATIEDCALRVVCSVVSAAQPGHAVIDAGKKTLTATLDPHSSGHGLAVGRPNLEIHTLSEECGWVRHDGDLQVGDRLQVIPNHACELTNLVDVVAYGVDDTIQGLWRPVARGKVW